MQKILHARTSSELDSTSQGTIPTTVLCSETLLHVCKTTHPWSTGFILSTRVELQHMLLPQDVITVHSCVVARRLKPALSLNLVLVNCCSLDVFVFWRFPHCPWRSLMSFLRSYSIVEWRCPLLQFDAELYFGQRNCRCRMHGQLRSLIRRSLTTASVRCPFAGHTCV